MACEGGGGIGYPHMRAFVPNHGFPRISFSAIPADESMPAARDGRGAAVARMPLPVAGIAFDADCSGPMAPGRSVRGRYRWTTPRMDGG